MQISTSQFYNRSTQQLNALSAKTDTLQTQISTGKRLTAPSDDAVAYRRLQGLATATADAKTWQSNIDLSQTLLKQSDTALDTIGSLIQQAQELTIQANNQAILEPNRQVVAGQLRSIIANLVSVANSSDARGGPLFGAATGAAAVAQDATTGAVSYVGTGDPASIPVGDGVDIQPTVSAERVFGGIAAGGSTTDVFALLNTLADAIDAGGDISATAATTLDGLKASLDQVNSTRGSLGARSARLDLEASRIQDATIAREAERSGLEDTNVTEAIAELQKTITVLQATQASFSKLSSLSLFDYLR